jgi:hypothetical protein
MIKDRTAIPAMCEALQRDKVDWMRGTIAQVLADFGATDAIPLIKKQLKRSIGRIARERLALALARPSFRASRIDCQARPVMRTLVATVKGEAKGIKQQGGLLDVVHREVEIECLPTDIPEHIEVDVTELMIGQAIRLRDVATDPTWKPVTDPD